MVLDSPIMRSSRQAGRIGQGSLEFIALPDAGGDEQGFWRRIYDGEIVRFGRCAPLERLVRRARDFARKAFGTRHPVHAHELHPRRKFFAVADAVQEEFRNDLQVRQLAARTVEAYGLDPEGLYFDTVELRIAPPVATHGGGTRSHVGVHRDLWGVAIAQQTNWWAPVWPVARRRTFAFYPEHWTRPIRNNTAEWSVKAYRQARAQAPPGTAPDYPSAPLALEAPACDPVPAVLRPGETLCFSSAHLHASVPNGTALTRFSLEWRSVREADIRADRGAPNIDCRTPSPVYRLFSRATDRVNLAQALAQ